MYVLWRILHRGLVLEVQKTWLWCATCWISLWCDVAWNYKPHIHALRDTAATGWMPPSLFCMPSLRGACLWLLYSYKRHTAPVKTHLPVVCTATCDRRLVNACVFDLVVFVLFNSLLLLIDCHARDFSVKVDIEITHVIVWLLQNYQNTALSVSVPVQNNTAAYAQAQQLIPPTSSSLAPPNNLSPRPNSAGKSHASAACHVMSMLQL